MHLLLPLAKGHLSNVATISWQIGGALLEGDYCIENTRVMLLLLAALTMEGVFKLRGPKIARTPALQCTCASFNRHTLIMPDGTLLVTLYWFRTYKPIS